MKRLVASLMLILGCTNIYGLEGIDVSHWDGDINFYDVANSGIDVVYIKVAQGDYFVDPKWQDNYYNATGAGLDVGFYHYITASNIDEAYEQANYFYNLIDGYDYDCFPVMEYILPSDNQNYVPISDYETNRVVLTYMEELSGLTNSDVMVYSNADRVANLWEEALSEYPLWIAQYGVNEPTYLGYWNSWAGFQYTDSGYVDGIYGDVDLNYFTDDIFLFSNSDVSTQYYTVQYGDTLEKIAQKYNVSLNQLIQLNDIYNPNLIYVGQVLKITSAPQTYTVQYGDTLEKIAQKYNVSLNQLIQLNNIYNPNLIYVGQVLYI